MAKKIEYRSSGRGAFEVREENGSGLFEGYACRWGELDDYNSMFEKGAFTKTLNERRDRIKILYQHKDPIGLPLELREDNVGLYVRGQLSLGVEKADEAFRLMKDKVIDTLSFGFNTISDYYKAGVRHIREVKLFEISPVVFASNDNAMITDVRATDFGETLNEQNLRRLGCDLQDALRCTIEDIWWQGGQVANADVVAQVGTAIDDFKTAFMKYAQAYLDTFRPVQGQPPYPPTADGMPDEMMRSLYGEADAWELRRYLHEENLTVEEMAQRSAFSIDELRGVLLGRLSIPRNKLASLPDRVRAAYQKRSNAELERVCATLRTNDALTNADRIRLSALLGLVAPAGDEERSSVVSSIAAYRDKLIGIGH